jgi:hypothetical protein
MASLCASKIRSVSVAEGGRSERSAGDATYLKRTGRETALLDADAEDLLHADDIVTVLEPDPESVGRAAEEITTVREGQQSCEKVKQREAHPFVCSLVEALA